MDVKYPPLKNQAKCLNCGDIIESKHRHDFVTCSCFVNSTDNKGIAIDGGPTFFDENGNATTYIRVLGTNIEYLPPEELEEV